MKTRMQEKGGEERKGTGHSGSILAFISPTRFGEEMLTWEAEEHYLPPFIVMSLPSYVVIIRFTLKRQDSCANITHVGRGT